MRINCPLNSPICRLFADLRVEHNALSGPIPGGYTSLTLDSFHFNDTGLCVPNTATFNDWLATIASVQRTNAPCRILDPEDAHFIATYNAKGERALPGTLVRIDDQEPTGDRDVDSAHDFAQATYSYFLNTHGRNSFDNDGALIVSTVHYGRNYNNAYWDGSQMVYGDGFAVRDVVAHELTHAVTGYTANLEYRWQSGALNESFSDIFGAMVDRADWLMGEDLAADARWRTRSHPQFGRPGQVWSTSAFRRLGTHLFG